jgi:CubicO group peptidase (beta-lactamase class C family)
MDSVYPDPGMTGKETIQGFSAARLDRIPAFLQQHYVEPGFIPGAQTLIWRRDEIVHHSLTGSMDLLRKQPMAADTICRIYSMTKPVTSVAVLMLLEEGLIALDDPVSRFLPGFAALRPADGTALPRAMTVLDLMRHTSGLTYGFLNRTAIDAEYRRLRIAEPDMDGGLSAMIAALESLPLEFAPGTAWNYSVATDVLGAIVEKVAAMPFADFLRTRILGPLGMSDTDFFVPPQKRERFATCYLMKDERLALWDNGLKTMRYGVPPLLASGGGGLAGTAADYLRFCRMLLRSGELDGVRLLSPKTVALMTRNHLPGGAEIAELMPSSDSFSETGYRGVGFGLGVAVTQDLSHAALPGSVGEYGWGGVAGTFFFIDPAEELILVFMTQVIDLQARRTRLRRDLRTLIYAAITESFA